MLTVLPETVTIETPPGSPTIFNVSLFDDGLIDAVVFAIFLKTESFNALFARDSVLLRRASTFVPCTNREFVLTVWAMTVVSTVTLP
jgi:hypothetical protein